MSIQIVPREVAEMIIKGFIDSRTVNDAIYKCKLMRDTKNKKNERLMKL